jgi:ADP-heptose:LPS heptosyltransferase
MTSKDMINNLLRTIVNKIIWGIGLFINKCNYKCNIRSNFLAILRTDNIGDFVLFAPSLKYIRDEFKDFQITLILKDTIVGLADDCPYVDRIISFDYKKYRRNLYYKCRFLLGLSRENFDICLYSAYSRERIGDEMVLWTAANQKIAWDSEAINLTPAEKVRGDRIYTTLFKIDCVQKKHEVERNREFLQNLKIQVDGFEPEVWVSDNDREKSRNFLMKNGLDRKRPIAILPGAMHERRKWGAPNFNRLIDRLVEVDKEAFILIIGIADENAGLDCHGGNIIDLCGRTNLKELPGLFERCSVVIGNETGTLHLAIASGAPTVCILGGGHFGRFMPYSDPRNHKFVYKKMDCFNCNWRCRYSFTKCIREINVEDVFSEVKKVLYR